MNFKHYFVIAVSLLLLSLLPSCHKDDDSSSTSSYLSGTMTFSIPSYVLCKQTFTVTPSGLTNPTTGKIGYYWKNTWEDGKDTTKTENGTGNGSYTFTTPDSIGQYVVECVAFATGYYTSAASDTIFVVDPEINTTVTDASLSYSDDHFTDTRDSKPYFTTTCGGKTWTKNNLGYDRTGISYKGCTAMDRIFGKFYTWEEAQTACPSGWHLPSEAEFTALANSVAPSGTTFKEKETFTGISGNLMVDAKFLEAKMWEFWPKVKITNKTGFAALPVGYAVDQNGTYRFSGMYSYAAFWTSDSDGENGFYRYFYVDKPDVLSGLGNKESFRASVRCVKD